MQLSDYLSTLEYGGKTKFAISIGISKSFLSQIEKGTVKCPAYLAKLVEEKTNGLVNKQQLRPDLWD